LKACYSRLRYKRLVFLTSDEVDVRFQEVNEHRFGNLFDVKYGKFSERWQITGKTWLSWIDFRIWFQRQRITWQHHDDLLVSEWVVFTFCHKAARAIDGAAQYRDETDNYLLPLDFDLKFPTIDLWIQQLNIVSGAPINMNIEEVRSRTPDCFWKA
jgi:hypothetical protein